MACAWAQEVQVMKINPLLLCARRWADRAHPRGLFVVASAGLPGARS
jgi:hypothetical protein